MDDAQKVHEDSVWGALRMLRRARESRDDPEGAGERARADGWGAGAGERGGDEPGQKRAVEKLLSECRIRERLQKLDPRLLASATDRVARPQPDGGAQDTSTAATRVTVAMDPRGDWTRTGGFRRARRQVRSSTCSRSRWPPGRTRQRPWVGF